jgi:hypothetical protein
MVITSRPLLNKRADRLNTLVSFQPESTPLAGQFSAGANTCRRRLNFDQECRLNFDQAL